MQEDDAQSTLDFYKQLYGKENVYLELQDHGMRQEREVLPRLIDLAQRTSTPMVVTNDAHYINAADAYPHDLLLCIQTVADYADPGRMRFDSQQYWLKSPQEIFANFHHFPEALTTHSPSPSSANWNWSWAPASCPSSPSPRGKPRTAIWRNSSAKAPSSATGR